MLESLPRSLAEASPLQFWMPFTLAAVCSAAALIAAFRLLARKRLMEDTPTAPLRSAAQGYVELCGKARSFDGEQIHAPLTGRTCCWYRFSVDVKTQQSSGRGQDRDRWQRIDGGVSTAIFMLDDGTSHCAVDPEGASITPSTRNVWYGSTRIPPRLVEANGWWQRACAEAFGGTYRYLEELIEIESPLYALGFLQTHGGAAMPVDSTSEASALLRELKSNRPELLRRYDRNGDGEIDATEWESARADAHATIAAQRSAIPPAVDLLSQPAHGGQPYILAARTQTEILRENARRSTLLLLGGSGLALTLCWILLLRWQGAG